MSIVQSGPRSFASVKEAASAIWALGWIIALICALVIGLCVEWPKSYWLLKSPSGKWWVSLVISVVSAEVLLHSLLQNTSQAFGGSDPGTLRFFAGAAAVGGVCSAAFWWWLVVQPGRSAAFPRQGQDADPVA
jgi:hypothetical protein